MKEGRKERRMEGKPEVAMKEGRKEGRMEERKE